MELDKIALSNTKFRNIGLADFLTGRTAALAPVEAALSSRGLSLIREGLLNLVNAFGASRFAGASLHGPTIEGTGEYPDVDSHLKIPKVPIWVAGDASGLFRGIVAGLISGYYVGLQAFRQDVDERSIEQAQEKS